MAQLLTPKQKALLDYLHSYRTERGYAPSQKEIAAHFGYRSLGTVQNYLTRLQREGFLERTWNARRGAVLAAVQEVAPAPAPVTALALPWVGRVAAGRLSEAIEQVDAERVEVPLSLLGARPGVEPEKNHFVLEVIGDSMIGDGILPGDWAVIRKQEQARRGQTVVALYKGEATLKRYYPSPLGIELRAANPKYEPIVIRSLTDDEFRLAGVLVGIVRRID